MQQSQMTSRSDGWVHIDHSLRRVIIETAPSDSGLTHLWVDWPVAATRQERTGGTNAGFGRYLDADAEETDFSACWGGTEPSRGQALTIHAAMCGETRGTTRLRRRGETGFTSDASASRWVDRPNLFGGEATQCSGPDLIASAARQGQ
jgi:hypothetical protein